MTLKLQDKAVKIHMYDISNILRPRGSMQKESIGIYIQEHLEAAYESWSNHEYIDAMESKDLLHQLHMNLLGEVNAAYGQFLIKVSEKEPEIVDSFIKSISS